MGKHFCSFCASVPNFFHMLGLRINPFASNTAGAPNASATNSAPLSAVDTQPVEKPQPQLQPEPEPEAHIQPTAVGKVETPLIDAMPAPMTMTSSFSSLDGFSTPPGSPKALAHGKGRFHGMGSRTTSAAYSSMNQVIHSNSNSYYEFGFVQETASSLKKKSISQLGSGVYQSVADTSFVGFLEWIKTERLTTLPHKGSRWDRVLVRALYFSEQLHRFDTAIQSFALNSNAAASIGYSHARLLLELESDNSEALDRAFSVFYRFSLSFSSILHQSEIIAATSDVREQLCLMYADLLSLVVDVAITFYKAVKGLTTSSVSIDIFESFGDTIEGFRSRQNKIVESIWAYQIESAGIDANEAVDVKTLTRFLSPHDRVLTSLSHDHTIFTDNQAEFTCLWFQKTLTKFLNGKEQSFLITGKPGSGKTSLAGSIMERLQRSVGRKTYDTVFFSISAAIPSQATSLALVKTLLLQLLNLRVGNVALYYALAWAHSKCRDATDIQLYENYLWKAFSEALKQPSEGDKDLIVVVDGLNEVTGDEKAPSAVLKKLCDVVFEAARARLIVFSTSTVETTANGTHYEITEEDIHEDIHAVALRALIRNSHFQAKDGPSQEALLDRLIHAANGSFLWAILAIEILKLDKTSEGFNKTFEILTASPGQVSDLVLKLFTVLAPSKESKQLVSWLLSSERPLTVEEIHSLFAIDSQKGIIADKGVDVDTVVHTLRPFVVIQDHVVRFKHVYLQNALRDLATRNKIQIPIKDSHTDILLRILTYIKITLREKREPSIDPDITLADRLFQQHHFLEYVVRYWVSHFRQTPLFPKSPAEFKPTPELQRVFPDSVTFALLEQISWDTQLPIPYALDRHILVSHVRKQILTENHLAVLQTYISLANSYTILSNVESAQTYYFSSAQISRTVLGDIHPLTLDSANRFLKITKNITTTTRDEVATRKEQILILLITASEKQYGSTSEIVIRTRRTLAELYESIKEQERAIEIYHLIEEITVKHYGKNSSQAQDIHGRLKVVISKGKEERDIQTYKGSFFSSTDNEGLVIDVFDTKQIAIWLHKAEEYLSYKEFFLAEKTYVELWQQISTRCRTGQSLEWHEKHLDVATAYSRFLQTQKRSFEASAVLVCIWQQYGKHQLSYSESIVTRLTSVAKALKSTGHYAVALSIFKFASSVYKSVRKEESSQSIDISREITETSKELVQQSLSTSTTLTTTTSTVSDSVFTDIFQSIISFNTLDTTTIKLAQKLTAQYIEQSNWSAAESVIKTTLHRSWNSFFSGSIHDVTLTSTFLQESVQSIESLAEVYRHQRRMDKVEDVYVRFFRAVLSAPTTDKAIFERAKTLLVTFYDKRGYPDNAISVYQDVLVVYKTVYGASHANTIQVLYTLGSRCRAHPRNHPYWIDYYQQIVTSLNKDLDYCHQDAMEAIIVVANSYWEDRRYAEAVTVFGVIWNTYIRKAKEYKQFTEVTFVQTLYERYFQCLEETGVSWSVLHKTTKEYRETSSAIFGAESIIAAEATLSLARVTQRSEEHASEAISLYEEASRFKSVSTSTSFTEIKQQLSLLYVRQLKSKMSTSMNSDTIKRAISIHEEQYVEITQKYGYSHESSLTRLQELVIMYSRQQKTEAAVKRITTAVSSIITEETSSQKLIESAAYIAASFQSVQQEQYSAQLIQELHRQLCARDARFASKWSFDLTKSNRNTLAFLASLEYNLRKDLAVSFAEIMADLIAEYIYFEQFTLTLKKKESMKNILIAGAPLRTFLLRKKLTDLAYFVEEEIVNLFVKRDANDLHVLRKGSPRLFITAILEYLGTHKGTNFNEAVILASNDHVAKLTQTKKFAEAYDVANLAFLFASNHKGYDGPNSIGHGFKLASILVGREGGKANEEALRKKMLELSNKIVRKIIDISKSLKINFARVQLSELSHLTALLGEQQDYATLEWLLTTLWQTRDAQRSWPAQVLVNLGRRLVCARYLAGHPVKAIRLCEDIAYNMRRAHGPRAPVTVDTYELLAELYTSTGLTYQAKAETEKTGHLAKEYFKKALFAHEDILRFLTQEDGEEDSEDEDTAATLLAENTGSTNGSVDGRFAESLDQSASHVNRPVLAIRHLQLLKLAFQRLGGWPKQLSEYERLNTNLSREFSGHEAWKGTQGVEKWSAREFGNGKAEKQEGVFEGVSEWHLTAEGMTGAVQQNGNGVVVDGDDEL
ncbi:unnamed protein product [Periconia digitata]|uniref:Nephrocystin 3-like N-terminal domain-containing protein n=1 Tax=Periconia digitata TaxID=1303443 RepID=A0A9W4UH25_9PLEO|nr:unnamed protein product [Periconia digitata]